MSSPFSFAAPTPAPATVPSPTPAAPGAAPVAAAAVAPVTDTVAAPVAAAQTDMRPPVGTVVQWSDYDIYDELQPERERVGLVMSYDESGAAQVLPLGEASGRSLAHFAPVPTDEGPHGPTVADLTPLTA